MAILTHGLTRIVVVASIVATAAVAAGNASPATAAISAPAAVSAMSADASAFDPGYIISDSAFYDGGAMDLAAVQNFLNGRVSSCSSGYTCLKDYRQDTYSRSADAMCSAYAGGSQESAAQIISKVGQACGISQRVLLVLLQKEQSLVTSRSPSSGAYRSATGYGCPDTSACDSQYYGFFNQVYKAAWQFKRYTNPAGTSKYFTWYPVGGTVGVLYNPNSGCGTKQVHIQNAATAGLYYYTPYTPNSAALSNLYGTGDGCSSYGNRNFWTFYNDWFGASVKPINPHGSIDMLAPHVGGVILAGWAADPDTTDSIAIHVYVDGSFFNQYLATQPRPDVPRVFAEAGPNSGFYQTLTLSGGTHLVCVYGINTGPGDNNLIAPCQSVTVPTDPEGSVDAVWPVAGGAYVAGWALDPDTTSPITVRIDVDGIAVKDYVAAGSRPDVASARPGYGDAHGFAGLISAASGVHQVCVWALNTGQGNDTRLGCSSVTVPSADPRGSLDAVIAVPGGAYVAGWTFDPDTSDAISYHIYVDGAFSDAFVADQSRPDVASAMPGIGVQHGFARTITLSSGDHSVCVWAINVGAGGNQQIGCRSVTVG